MWVPTVDFMKAFDSISQSSLWNTLEQCGTESQYVSLFKRPYAQQKATDLTDKESDVFEIKRRTKQGDLLSSLLFNTVLQVALKDDLARWQKRGMGICFGDSESDCLTNLRFADDVLLFFTSLEQLQRMMCDFKRSTERVGLKIHLERTKILSNQNSNRRREVAIKNIKVEVSPVHGCAKYLGQKIIATTGDNRNQESNSCCLGVVLQVQKGVDVKITTPTESTPFVQYGDLSDTDLRIRNVDPDKGTRENDTIDSAQNAPTRCANKKEVQEEDTRQQRRNEEGQQTKNEKGEDGEERESNGSSEDETVEGSSSNTDCDQDSDVFFKNDTDEGIDTA